MTITSASLELAASFIRRWTKWTCVSWEATSSRARAYSTIHRKIYRETLWRRHKARTPFTIAEYLAAVDRLMATQVRRQLSGLMMLQLTTKWGKTPRLYGCVWRLANMDCAQDIPSARDYSRTIRGHIKKQLDLAYSFYPPVIRIRPSHEIDIISRY